MEKLIDRCISNAESLVQLFDDLSDRKSEINKLEMAARIILIILNFELRYEFRVEIGVRLDWKLIISKFKGILKILRIHI